MRNKISFFFAVLLLLCASPAYAATILVSTTGTDDATCGGTGDECATIEYAVESRAASGDTVSIADGTYNEGLLTVPVGVSIQGNTGDDPSGTMSVNVFPTVNLGMTTPWITLESASPGSTGNQTISYIGFDGVNGGNQVMYAISVENRNTVRIHHCAFVDFYDPANTNASEPGYITVRVASSNWNSSGGKWWDVWPYDPGVLGDDSSMDALWPANPVEGFEFDNNTITNGTAIRLRHLKDSSIHDNVLDNSSTYEWTINGAPAILNNVDIYNNTLLANPTGTEEGDPSNSIYTMELWVWRGGCQVYNNTTNAFFSLTMGKETKVYNNTLSPVAGGDTVARPNKGIGLELIGQSYLEAYGNYVANNHARGIGSGHGEYGGDGTVRDITIRNNVIVGGAGYADAGIMISCLGRVAGHTPSVTGVDIFNNAVYGSTYTQGIKVASDMGASTSATLEDVSVKNNIMMNIGGYAGKVDGDGTITNLVINTNMAYGCTNNGWQDSWDGGTPSVSNQLVFDPDFAGPTTTFNGFALSAGSPAIDAGLDVGLAYNGTAPDIGAIETGVTTDPQPTVTGLSPTSGPEAGGTAVTITGTGFDGANPSVAFGGSAASFSVTNSTTIAATSPPGTGTVGVSVTTAGGTSTNTAADDFTYTAPSGGTETEHIVDNTDAGFSVLAGGWTETSSGTQFYGTNWRWSPISADDREVQWDTGSHAAGTIAVSAWWVSDAGYTASIDYRVYSDTTLLGTYTVSQQANGGQWNELVTGLSVPGSTNIIVKLMDDDATAVVTADAIKVVHTATTTAPSITDVSPTSGAAAGGTSVTITGTGFTDATSVLFGAGISVQQLAFFNRAGVPHELPADFTLDYSAGGTTWTTVRTVTGATYTENQWNDFSGDPGTTPHLYWRVHMTDPVSSTWGFSVGELEFRSAVGGEQAASDWTAIASGNWPGYGPELAFDGIVSTTDSTNGWAVNALDAWLGYYFSGTAAASYTVDSDTQITATTPAGVGTENVTVITAEGSDTLESAFEFTSEQIKKGGWWFLN